MSYPPKRKVTREYQPEENRRWNLPLSLVHCQPVAHQKERQALVRNR